MVDLKRLCDDIDSAATRISRFIPPTPVLRISCLDHLIDGEVFLKAECLQPTGSFKIRGALNVMVQLVETGHMGKVIAFSSGNHGIGVAYAARCLGMSASIVMPQDAPQVKINQIEKLGADIVFFDRDTEDREQIAFILGEQRKTPIVKPYDDWNTIIGQGTCGVEIQSQITDGLDSAIVCTGGGGLMAGIGSYLKYYFPKIALYTAEPVGWDDHRVSLASGVRTAVTGEGSTSCDGLLARIPGTLTFPINYSNGVSGLVAQDSMIARAMELVWYALGIKLEPSGAIGLACLMNTPERYKGQRVLVTLTGKNVDSLQFDRFLGSTGR